MQPRLVTLIFHSFTYPRKKTTLHSLLTKQYSFECKTMYLLREDIICCSSGLNVYLAKWKLRHVPIVLIV